MPKGSRCVQWRWAAAKTCKQASLRKCSSTSTSRSARMPRAGTRCTAGPRGRPAGHHMRPRPARPPRPLRTAPVRRSWCLGSWGCLPPDRCSCCQPHMYGMHVPNAGVAEPCKCKAPTSGVLLVRSAHRTCQRPSSSVRGMPPLPPHDHAATRQARQKAGATKKVSRSGSRPSRRIGQSRLGAPRGGGLVAVQPPIQDLVRPCSACTTMPWATSTLAQCLR